MRLSDEELREIENAVEVSRGVAGGLPENCAVRDIKRLLEHIKALEEWHPIETAPVHGEALLGYSPGYKEVFVFVINGSSWWSPGFGHMPLDHPLFPTLWKPLPEPPAQEGGSYES